jgi:alpha-beta hydrolase superfamily lysophospholipase
VSTVSRSESVESSGLTGVPLWLDVSPEPIFGVLHTPHASGQARLAALILPTFGWDNDCSYRARRDWATALAESGVATLRVDLPGTENSVGSPLGPNRVQTWVDATTTAAQWLRKRSDCDRLVVIGIGLGGLIAHQAAVAGAPIDDMVLWGVRASGRAYVRELRAYAAVVAGQFEEAQVDDGDDVIAIGGYAMSTETAQALGSIKLADSALPQANLRRVLLISRDAHGIDEKLLTGLSESGAAVTVLETNDYRSLIAPPEYGMRPTRTISESVAWLLNPSAGELAQIQHGELPTVPEVVDCVEFERDGVTIRERLSSIETAGGRVVGIISEPASGPRASHCLVVINAGALRHTGPNRIFVEIARSAAAIGVPTVRFDLPGLGDSDGKAKNVFEYGPESDIASLAVLRRIFDHAQGLGIADRFVTTGMSLGGNLAVRAVAEDQRVVGAIGINVPALGFTDRPSSLSRRAAVVYAGLEAMATERPRQRLPAPLRAMVNRLTLARQTIDMRLRNRLAPIDVLWRLAHRADVGELSKGLDQLGGSGAHVLILLVKSEWMVRLFTKPKLRQQLQRAQNIEVEELNSRDHLLRPLWIQKMLIDRVTLAASEFDSRAKEGQSSGN